MKLLDAANVTTRGAGNWERGTDTDTRGCGGVTVYLGDCDPDVAHDVIGDSTDLVGTPDCGYRVIPFPIVATLTRGTRDSRDDDQNWLADALKEASEIPVARGLMIQQGNTDTWIGNDVVEEIPAPALGDKPAVQGAVDAGRRLFFRKTFGLKPIFHVNPGNMIALKDAGIISIDPVTGDDRTIWGDPVVISEGYYNIDGMTDNPAAFWTGPIDITLSEVKPEDVIQVTRQNRVLHQVTMLAQIDTAPCAMVRIGPAPALEG